jgi:ligand-binding SRPBCC domain-containing protein
MPRFEASSLIQAPAGVVFSFHEKPEAFEILMPPGRKFQILRREGGIQDGGEIEFRLRLGPFWVRWHARHSGYQKNVVFVDEQVRGPFRRWIHRHEFHAEGRNTRLTDSIDFSLPGGALVDFALGWAARLVLGRIFDFRHRVTRRVAERMAREIARLG